MTTDTRRRVMLALGGLVALVLAYFLLFIFLPDRMIDGNDFVRQDGTRDAAAEEKARNDLRTATIQFLALLVVVSGAIFTGRTFYTNRQGQITDRFTKAIAQLGDRAAVDIRLGGIYALERIARESRYDHGPVTEVLTAFAREHRASGVGEEPARESRPGKPPADVQAAVSVLGRRRLEHEGDEGPVTLNLRGIQLRGGGLRGDDRRESGRFDRVDLSGAALEGVDFSKASLEGATMNHAQLEGARFYWTTLDRCFLERADLQGAIFVGGTPGSATFSYARCEGIWVSGAEEGPSGLTTSFEGASFVDVSMRDAFLVRAQLQGAVLKRVDLTGADLREAQLWGATLLNVNLEGANLTDADLRGAQADGSTVWPGGFDPEAAGLGRRWEGSASDHRGTERSHQTVSDLVLNGVDLRGASFTNSTLEAPNLEQVNARGTRFDSATLNGGVLRGADLRGSGMGSAKLEAVDLARADLRGADLKRATLNVRLDGIRLAGAHYDGDTVWPDDFDPQAAGAILER